MSYQLICNDCGKSYSPADVEYVCPTCYPKTEKGFSPNGILTCEYDYAAVAKVMNPDILKNVSETDHCRYLSLLPLQSADSLPELPIGPTPLLVAARLRETLGLRNLFIKNDTVLPTGSYKDRASSVVVAKARELGKEVVTTASTGNAATALAGMCADVGMTSVIFVPAAAPVAKLTQIATFGARLIPVDGTYDDAFALSIQATEAFGWYNRNTAYNPYTIEGKKTAAFEIWEQLGFEMPDKVLVPTGDGVILSGIYKGFCDLKACGLIDAIPQMIAVQAMTSNAICQALEQDGGDVEGLSSAPTIADSISVATPAAGRYALKAIRASHGFGVTVSDDEILAAIPWCAGLTGVFLEPAAAAAMAGLKLLADQRQLKSDETIVVMGTGTGLKDIPAAQKGVHLPDPIQPTRDALEKIL